MHTLSEHQLLVALAALAVILLFARASGEVARRLGQPEVLGELLAGFVLGPSIFGAFFPSIHDALFMNPAASTVLAGLSWLGAIMVLLIAGMEVDLAILRRYARSMGLAAAFAIVPSLIAGSVFAALVLHRFPPDGFFLGIVLSVTAVSVAAKVMIEQGVLRRGYAQLILAAGVASEVLVWLLVSIVSSFHGSSPLATGLRSTAYAIAFFLFMITVGRRVTFWAMRRVRDVSWIVKGQLSLVLILTFAAAGLTQALGLHALLGAFVVGVLLSQAPRANHQLAEGIESLTIGFLGPIFFVLAGMRVDILQLGSLTSVATVLLLLFVATLVKVGLSALGARLGGQRGWEAALVGVGLNLKGGTDVVVAVVGTELGLLTTRAYSMYAVVAILTVLFSPALMQFLAAKSPPTEEEEKRLENEEAERRSYVTSIERVLVPVDKSLLPSLAASVVERIAQSKHEHGQLFDITRMEVQRDASRGTTESRSANDQLKEVGNLPKVEVSETKVGRPAALRRILEASRDYDLVAIGARPPAPGKLLTLGRLQDTIIDESATDVLVAIDQDAASFSCSTVRSILVPINGQDFSMAAGDVAGALGVSCGARVVLFHVVQSDMDEIFWRERDEQRLHSAGDRVLDEITFRVERMGAPVEKKVVTADNPGDAILDELASEPYDLVVIGGVDRGRDGKPYMGRTVRSVLLKSKTPMVLLTTHSRAAEGHGPAAAAR